ncbi:hypothetical protein GMES_4468 [Paraglaciecola mesophila KMM 241]|uniref:Uncharacterized protein n=1 Tax=Paraglaciecola mesophila KMM 241 TaxID=1128912 RepID=K6Y1M3_9ALTE|nr:hypothetical protein GMES_4468 [Paraglaciecola mesophila KMM 241]
MLPKSLLMLIKGCLYYYSALCIAFEFIGADNHLISLGK